MNPTLNVALKAARDAAEAIAHASDRIDRIKILNADPGNFLTSLDLEAEKTLKFHILKSFPEHSIKSRTSDSIEGKKESIIFPNNGLFSPTNVATKGVNGLLYTSSQGPICSSSPSFMTAIRSDIVSASP